MVIKGNYPKIALFQIVWTSTIGHKFSRCVIYNGQYGQKIPMILQLYS